jgi:hypothetical protein
MNEQVKAIVEGFLHLSDADQTDAYVEIEAIWRNLPDDPPTPSLPYLEPRKAPSSESAS